MFYQKLYTFMQCRNITNINQKSIFASRLSILAFGKRCLVDDPRRRIQQLLQAVEGTLLHELELVEAAPDVAAAIRRCALPYEQSFG